MWSVNLQRKVRFIEIVYTAHGQGKNGAGTFAAQLMSVHKTAIPNSPKTMPKKNGRSR